MAHNPAAAGLAQNFRYTALEVGPGSGLWQSATRLGAVQRRYLDPRSTRWCITWIDLDVPTAPGW